MRDEARTALQFYSHLILHVLESARDDDELDERAYRAFLDIAFRRITSDIVDAGLDEWREAA